MYGIQRSTERFVKNIAYPCPSAQLGGLNVSCGTLDGTTIGGGEFCDDLEQRLALIGDVLPIGVQERLELGHHQIDPGLQRKIPQE